LANACPDNAIVSSGVQGDNGRMTDGQLTAIDRVFAHAYHVFLSALLALVLIAILSKTVFISSVIMLLRQVSTSTNQILLFQLPSLFK
jgi:hypothetical protein